ncbi:MAG: hypothetical protein ACI85N_000090 [Gammaproteobacteria bacterium]|jgi:hypothetical protein
MEAIVHKQKNAGDGRISFPTLHCWNPETEIITIAAQVSGKRVSCRIAYADIKTKYPVVADTPLETVIKYRKEIENAAKELIENKKYEKDGSIKIDYVNL